MESVMRKLVFSAAVLLVAVAGFAPAQQSTPAPALPFVELPPALDRVLRDYERAWRARDPAALAELFTEDGFVLANGNPPVRGRAAIRAAYANGGGPLSLRALAYATEGRVGYIIGGFGRAPGEPDSGKFVLALRQGSDGRWQIAADMDNSNRRTWVAPTPTVTPVSPKREQ
jgi:ketosteroid isomerase-like protein